VQRLLTLSLNLTRQGLTYRYGSSDPTSGGMDCSGTIYYLLKQAGVKEPPRDSSGLYLWAEKEGTLRRVSPASLDDPALADLRPGDLMFWEGTYEVQRDPPISHTMIYLGKEKATGMPVMVGASDGRTYGGVRRNGVSVFDFRLPRSDSAAKFVAYGRVPGIENLGNGKGK
jgi:cell wall-associated NlpC family hydrolase